MNNTLAPSLRLFCLLLLCGRAGLLVHELLGHALPALILGGTIEAIHLNLFGGGCVHYALTGDPSSHDSARAIITAGGVLAELAMSGLCLASASWLRSSKSWQHMLNSLGLVLAIHPVFYFQDGLWYGYGDARILLDAHFQDFRFASFGLLAGMIMLGYVLCRRHAAPLIRWLMQDASPPTPLSRLFLALTLAISFHAVLTLGETLMFKDATCNSVFIQEHEVRIEQEMKRYRADPSRPQDAQALQDHLETLTRELTPWPLRWLAISLLCLGMLIGTLHSHRHRQADSTPPPFGHQPMLAALFLLSLILLVQ